MTHTHTKFTIPVQRPFAKRGGEAAVIDFSENTLPKSAPDILAMDRKQ